MYTVVMVRKSLFFALIFLFTAAMAQAQSVTLAWDAPTTNADGTPLTDLAGYRIYLSYAPIPDDHGDATRIADVAADQTETTVDVGALPVVGAVIFFRASAYDTSGNESALSNEVAHDSMPPHTIIIRFQ